MRRVAVCLFYALCVFTIAFSLFWMALPRLERSSPAPQEADNSQPSLAAQALPDTSAPQRYLLCDEGGMVAVYLCDAAGCPVQRLETTRIYVNLLPENDVLRIKQGLAVTGDAALQQLLEDLGG